jgi:hypothetical protein
MTKTGRATTPHVTPYAWVPMDRRHELQLALFGHGDPAAAQAQHCGDALGELSQRWSVKVVVLRQNHCEP